MSNQPVFTRKWRAAYWIALGLVLLGFLWYYHIGYEELLTAKKHEIQALANIKATSLAAWRRERLADAAEITGSARITQDAEQVIAHPDDIQARLELADWLHAFQRQGDYRSILLLAPGARCWPIVGASNETPAALTWAMAQQCWQTRRAVFSQPYRPAGGQGELCLDIIAPFAAGQGTGAVLLRILASHALDPKLDSFPPLYPGIKFRLVRREKDDLVLLSPLQAVSQEDARVPFEKTSLQPLLKDPQALLVRDYRGRAVLATVAPIVGSDWLLLVKVDAKELLAPWHDRILKLALLAMLGFAFIMIGQMAYRARRDAWHWRQLQKTQATLTESVNHMRDLEEIIEASPVVALLFPSDQPEQTRYISTNIRQFGYFAADFYSNLVSYRTLICAADWADNAAAIQRHVQAGDASFQHDCRIELRAGATCPVHQYFSLRQLPDGNSLLQVLIVA